MKITTKTLKTIWKKELKNMAPSPRKDSLKNLSFKRWLVASGPDICKSINSLEGEVEFSDKALKLLAEWL